MKQNKIILLTEDNPLTLMVEKRIFKQCNFSVMVAKTSEEVAEIKKREFY